MLMKRMLVAICGLLVAGTAVSAETSCQRGSEAHTIYVQKNGFFPSKLFVCEGDKVFFLNRSGYWAKFNQNTTTVAGFNSYWLSNGSSAGPLVVRSGMGMRVENLDLWNVSNNTYPLLMENGDAPDQY